jgi:hypothetical protein
MFEPGIGYLFGCDGVALLYIISLLSFYLSVSANGTMAKD